jgi:ABC-2 type transport system permease protein
VVGGLINKEEGRHTLELLLARPVGRSQLLLAKATAGMAVIAILGAVTAAATILYGLAVHIDVSAGNIALTTLWMVLFSGAFGAVAFMLYTASLVTRHVAVVIAILLSMGGYILSSLGNMVHSLSWIAKLFPYHYYDPGNVLKGHVSASFFIYIVVMYAVSISVRLIGFRRRDIN